MKIEWKRKLTSRKFWAALISFVTSIMAYCGASDSTVTRVTAIIMGGATLIAYIIGEGIIDARRQEDGTYKTGETEPKRTEEPGIETVRLVSEPVYNTEGEGKGD